MRIKEIIEQTRRDFTAIYVCKHCGHEEKGHGYDDSYFHQNVIPAKKCHSCGKTAAEDYRALTTRYPDSAVI